MKMGWHYTPCETASSGGGGLVAFVLFAVVVGGAVVSVVRWVVDAVAAVGRSVVAAAPALVAVAAVVAVGLLVVVVWAVAWSRRQPARRPVDPPRYRPSTALGQTPIRPVDQAEHDALEAERVRLVAELTAPVEMPATIGKAVDR